MCYLIMPGDGRGAGCDWGAARGRLLHTGLVYGGRALGCGGGPDRRVEEQGAVLGGARGLAAAAGEQGAEDGGHLCVSGVQDDHASG